jgi:hypothetical protein
MAIFYGLGVGAPIAGGIANGVVFADADGKLAQDTKFWFNATTKRLVLNTLSPGSVPLTIAGDDTTGNIMLWSHGTKAVLMSCNGFSPTNLSIPFHVNLGGSTQSFAIREDDAGRAASDHQFQLFGSKTGRTVAQMKITQGPTPGVGGHALLIENNSAQAQFAIDSNGRILAAPAGTALPGSQGTLNIKSVSGFGLMIDETTNYTSNLLSLNGDYSIQTATVFFGGRQIARQGPDIAAANNLVLGTGQFTSGNYYVVTGNTTINLLSKASWQDGALVTLHFTGTPTVKNDQASSGNNTKILLTGGGDLVVASPCNLTLRLCTKGGVQAWRQESPVLTVA